MLETRWKHNVRCNFFSRPLYFCNFLTFLITCCIQQKKTEEQGHFPECNVTLLSCHDSTIKRSRVMSPHISHTLNELQISIIISCKRAQTLLSLLGSWRPWCMAGVLLLYHHVAKMMTSSNLVWEKMILIHLFKEKMMVILKRYLYLRSARPGQRKRKEQ